MSKLSVIDSGTGGLTSLVPLIHKYYFENIYYLADFANLPYGNKSPSLIHKIMHKNLQWMHSNKNSNSTIIACNTASALCGSDFTNYSQNHNFPIYNVVDSVCDLVQRIPHDSYKKIVVAATTATVKSDCYRKKLSNAFLNKEIVSVACPLFVSIVEEHLQQSTIAEQAIRIYLDHVIEDGDLVILGCTHYPYLLPMFKKLYPQCRFLESGEALLITCTDYSSQKSNQPKIPFEMNTTDNCFSIDNLNRQLNDLGILEKLEVTLNYVIF